MTYRKRMRAFTLVELLVVIGIIAILISILLPGLARARRAANTVACAANLRTIMQGVNIFASEHQGQLPGSPGTTGKFALLSDNNVNTALYNGNNFPNVCQLMDWETPVAKSMGVKLDEGGSPASRLSRFQTLRNFKVFQCPEAANILEGPFTGSGDPATAMMPVGPMMSYAAASYFLLLPNGSGGPFYKVQIGSNATETPSGYRPALNKIRKSSQKIFIADGARYSSITSPPDIDLTYDSSGGGAFADVGPWSNRTKCWDRYRAPGNSLVTGFDPRVLSFRHGNGRPGGPANTFKMNAAFFDGHVELIGDLDACDPSLWMPSGSTIALGGQYGDTPFVDAGRKFNIVNGSVVR